MSIGFDADEILDLVDQKDQVIGTIVRKDALDLAITKLGFIRAADAFIQNEKGELWIPRRQPTKKIAPNGLDFSVAEHVSSGENYLEAIIRGFQEELNMVIKSSDLKELGMIPPTLNLAYFNNVYLYQSNESPNFNLDDFGSYEWLMPGELIKRLEAGERAKASLLPALKKFFT